MNIKTFVVSRPKELIFKDGVKEFFPLNSKNIIDIFKRCSIVINTIPYNIIPEEALITNVQNSINFASSQMTYRIQAISTGVLSKALVRSWPARRIKPS